MQVQAYNNNIFEPKTVTSGASGASKKFSTLAIARHILRPHKLFYNLTTANKR